MKSFTTLLLLFICTHVFSQKNVLFQYATFNSLAGGVYDGELKTGELQKKGNLGLGTFNSLNGELILLDSFCYRALTDSLKQVEVVQNAETPFAMCTFFQKDDSLFFPYASRMQLDSVLLNRISMNVIVAFKLEGKFSYIKFRSVARQKKPYKILGEAVKQQKIFEKANIQGTLVGFYFPSYMNGLNVEGFHWHFISDDNSCGGHVLDYQAENLLIEWAKMTSYQLQFPQNTDFQNSSYKAGKNETAVIEKGK